MEAKEGLEKGGVVKEFLQNVTLRSILIGVACVFVIAILVPFSDVKIMGTYLAQDFIPIVAVLFFTFIIVVVNVLIRLFNRAKGLSDAELTVIFIMMLVSSAIPSMGLMEYLLPSIAGFKYYSSSANQWDTLLRPYVSEWIYVNDADAVRYFFEGLPKGMEIPWGAWVKPLISWGIFILMLYFVMLCISVIFRKQWVDREKLTFPLVQLPLEMLKREKPDNLISDFFKNRMMWIGFAIPAIISTWKELYNHGLMLVPIQTSWSIHFTVGGSTTNLPLVLSMPIAGFAFLVNLDVAFSMWFFHLFGMVQKLLFFKFGYTIGSAMTYNDEMPPTLAHEGMGALIMFVLFGLWIARKHVADIFKKAIGKGEGIDDSGELFSYRLALFGAVAGIILLAVWSTLAGMNFAIALFFIVISLFVFIGVTRAVAEGGLSFIQSPYIPEAFTASTFGTKVVSNGDLGVMGFHFLWMADIRAFIMPAFANTLKLTDTVKIKSRQLFWGILAAILISMVVSCIYTIKSCYETGGINLEGWFYRVAPVMSFDGMADFIKNNSGINWGGLLWDGIGAGFMAFLMYMRYRFLWWPIHPVGFPISNTFAMRMSWFAIFISWLFKSLIIKYGGERLYRTVRPLFLGLIFGEFVTDGLWIFIDFLTHKTGHVLFNG